MNPLNELKLESRVRNQLRARRAVLTYLWRDRPDRDPATERRALVEHAFLLNTLLLIRQSNAVHF